MANNHTFQVKSGLTVKGGAVDFSNASSITGIDTTKVKYADSVTLAGNDPRTDGFGVTGGPTINLSGSNMTGLASGGSFANEFGTTIGGGVSFTTGTGTGDVWSTHVPASSAGFIVTNNTGQDIDLSSSRIDMSITVSNYVAGSFVQVYAQIDGYNGIQNAYNDLFFDIQGNGTLSDHSAQDTGANMTWADGDTLAFAFQSDSSIDADIVVDSFKLSVDENSITTLTADSTTPQNVSATKADTHEYFGVYTGSAATPADTDYTWLKIGEENLATVATSGSYADLTNKQETFIRYADAEVLAYPATGLKLYNTASIDTRDSASPTTLLSPGVGTWTMDTANASDFTITSPTVAGEASHSNDAVALKIVNNTGSAIDMTDASMFVDITVSNYVSGGGFRLYADNEYAWGSSRFFYMDRDGGDPTTSFDANPGGNGNYKVHVTTTNHNVGNNGLGGGETTWAAGDTMYIFVQDGTINAEVTINYLAINFASGGYNTEYDQVESYTNSGTTTTANTTLLGTYKGNTASTDDADYTWVELGGTSSINDLSDVDITTNAPTNGQILAWDGTNFVPSDDAGATYLATNANGAAPVASGTDAIALGEDLTVSGTNSVAIGRNMTIAGAGNTAIGNSAEIVSTSTASIAMGPFAAVDGGTGSIAIGLYSQAGTGGSTGQSSVALGNGADAQANGATAVGPESDAGSTDSVAIGNFSDVSATGATNSIAIGRVATVADNHSNSIALGAGSATTAANQIMLGDTNVTDVAVANTSYTPANNGSLTNKAYVDANAMSVRYADYFESATPVAAILDYSSSPAIATSAVDTGVYNWSTHLPTETYLSGMTFTAASTAGSGSTATDGALLDITDATVWENGVGQAQVKFTVTNYTADFYVTVRFGPTVGGVSMMNEFVLVNGNGQYTLTETATSHSSYSFSAGQDVRMGFNVSNNSTGASIRIDEVRVSSSTNVADIATADTYVNSGTTHDADKAMIGIKTGAATTTDTDYNWSYVAHQNIGGTSNTAGQVLMINEDADGVVWDLPTELKYFDAQWSSGTLPTATGIDSIAIGGEANASATDTIAIGARAVAQGNWAISIGNLANCDSSSGSSVALGERAEVNAGTEAVSIGYDAHCEGDGMIAIGDRSGQRSFGATSAGMVAIGQSATASIASADAVLIGHSAFVSGADSTVIGANARATGGITNAMAIGHDAQVTASNSVVIGDANVTSISMGNTSYSPSANGDLATKQYVDENGGDSSTSTSVSTTASTTIGTWSSGAGNSYAAEVTVMARDTVNNNVEIVKFLVAYNGSAINATEYGQTDTGTAPTTTYDFAESSGTVTMTVVQGSSDQHDYVVSYKTL